MAQTIIRCKQKRSDQYAAIDSQEVENQELSWKAKGLLMYLRSLPDDHQICVADLISHGTDGESSVRSGLNELESHGYIVRNRGVRK